MKTSNISNLSIQNTMRQTVRDAQIELVKAQTEATTGKYSDIGATLGTKAALSVDLNRAVDRIESLSKTNTTAKVRLESSQEAMNNMAKNSDSIKSQLVLVQQSGDSSTIKAMVMTASNALDAFTGAANLAVGGEYVFAGINTDVKPLADYNDASSGLSADFDTAFQAYFGFPKTDTAQTYQIAASGTAPSMDDFLTSVVEPMFQDPAWSTNWSSATDDTMTSRISQSEVVQTSTSANTNAFKKFALAAVAAKELIGLNLQDATRVSLVKKVIDYNNEANAGLIDERTTLALSQARVESANDSLAVQKDIIKNQLNDVVGVDAYEASTRVNNLLSLTQASYTLTARIQQLSLVNYL
jgi:flagellar hook-associated protein 3 FlgL